MNLSPFCVSMFYCERMDVSHSFLLKFHFSKRLVIAFSSHLDIQIFFYGIWIALLPFYWEDVFGRRVKFCLIFAFFASLILKIYSNWYTSTHLSGAHLGVGRGGVLPCPNLLLEFCALCYLKLPIVCPILTWIVPSFHGIITLK